MERTLRTYEEENNLHFRIRNSQLTENYNMFGVVVWRANNTEILADCVLLIAFTLLPMLMLLPVSLL